MKYSGLVFLLLVIIGVLAFKLNQASISTSSATPPAAASPATVAPASTAFLTTTYFGHTGAEWIARLNDRDPDVQKLAEDTLVRIGTPARESLVAAAKDEHRDTREGALLALRRVYHADKALLPLFLDALHDHDGPQFQAAAALQAYSEEAAPATPFLISILNSDSVAVRSAASATLVSIGEPARQPLIDEVLHEGFSSIAAFHLLENTSKLNADTWSQLTKAPTGYLAQTAERHLREIFPAHPEIQKIDSATALATATVELEPALARLAKGEVTLAHLQKRIDEELVVQKNAQADAAAFLKKYSKLAIPEDIVNRYNNSRDTSATLALSLEETGYGVKALRRQVEQLKAKIAEESKQ